MVAVGVINLPMFMGTASTAGPSPDTSTSHRYRVLLVKRLGEAQKLFGAPTTAWGLHVDDPNLAMGNLVQLVKSETAAYLAAQPVVALTAATVTTISDGSAGPGRRPGALPSSLTTRGASTDSAPAPQLCRVIDEVDRLTVTRTDAFPQNGFTFSFPARVTIRATTVASAVAHAVCALRLVPKTGAFSCPAAFGIAYHLVFTRETGGSVEPVAADATGCQFLTGAGPGTQAMFTSNAFWAKLGRAMGLAHPTSATFRGSQRQA